MNAEEGFPDYGLVITDYVEIVNRHMNIGKYARDGLLGFHDFFLAGLYTFKLSCPSVGSHICKAFLKPVLHLKCKRITYILKSKEKKC